MKFYLKIIREYFEQSLNLSRTQNDKANELRSLLGLIPLYHRQKPENKAVANNTLQQAMVVMSTC
ncbi:hypothetical protein F7734_13890 [Scytonema sp. UIC 10036]|uniref:hypothetical protein n=1 Tax=Scytonema sp. UIC 10036 TaxID=2304196 RepID=UPI0012DA0F3D|nr:hypothetical protein [Scytonema sp. UIC 10036]MUG93462.1 hypothetical protein [Scytonema sp. UIC 10036]